MEKKSIFDLNKSLEKEFNDLGFASKDITDAPIHLSNFKTIISIRINLPNPPGSLASFSLLIVNPLSANDCFIDYINVRLLDSEFNDSKILYERDFYKSDGAFPKKEEMVDEMVKSQRIETIQQILKETNSGRISLNSKKRI